MSGTFSNNLAENIDTLEKIFKGDETFRKRLFSTEAGNKIKFCAFFIDGMVNREVINESIIRPVVQWKPLVPNYSAKYISENVIQTNEISLVNDKSMIIDVMLRGDTIIFVDGDSEAIVVNTKGFPVRAVEQPQKERSQNGPRDGFGETIMPNLALLRRRITSDKLRFEFIKLGQKTKTNVCIISLDGTTDADVLKEVKKRVSSVDLDGIFSCNYIEEIIKDRPYSPFKTMGLTEKPDIVAARLLEGRVGIMVDGSPEVLTAPYLLIESFQSTDDYYANFYMASFSRLVRIIGFLLSVFTPAVYIALVTLHTELIPTSLLLSISAARQGIPFPSVLETLMLLLAFHILQEAGSKAPPDVGTALSIVGALVLGQAAVEARFVSSPVVIIVAFSGITALIVPKLMDIMLGMRLILIVLASIFGIFGILVGTTFILLHVSTLKSFGIPCIASYSPNSSLEDIYVRFPWSKMKPNKRFIAERNIQNAQNK